jgi:hypothetical protein
MTVQVEQEQATEPENREDNVDLLSETDESSLVLYRQHLARKHRLCYAQH